MAEGCSGELYRILEVESSASSDEIRQAYRRKALQLHPDRTGGTTTAEFQTIQQANEVLSDPHTRLLYNALGRKGMMTLSAPDPREINPAVGCVVTCLVLIINVCLLIFAALTVTNLDSRRGYRWANVFIPLWVICAPLALGAIVSMVVSIRVMSCLAAFRSLFVFAGIVALVLLALALDTTVPWAPIFYYYFAVQGVYILAQLVHLLPSRTLAEVVNHGVAGECGWTSQLTLLYLCNVGGRILVPVLLLIFLILLYLRIVVLSFINFSIYSAFAPLYAAVAVQGFVTSVKAVVISSMLVDAMPVVLSVCRVLCGTIFYVFIVGYTPLLISIKTQREVNEGRSGPSAAVCAIMAFIFFGLAVLASLCGSCLLLCARASGVTEEDSKSGDP